MSGQRPQVGSVMGLFRCSPGPTSVHVFARLDRCTARFLASLQLEKFSSSALCQGNSNVIFYVNKVRKDNGRSFVNLEFIHIIWQPQHREPHQSLTSTQATRSPQRLLAGRMVPSLGLEWKLI